MNRSDDSGGLNQGGPSDQAGPRPDSRECGGEGSQQGRPQNQAAQEDEREARKRPGRPAQETAADSPAASDEPAELRGVSDTERAAGTPDPRATTDWTHGEGEPEANRRQP
jgi:hypothetical protein